MSFNPLPPSVEALLKQERDIPRAPVGAAQQVRDRLRATLVAQPVPPPEAPTSAVPHLLASKAVIAAVSFVLGGASVGLWMKREPAPPPPPPPATVPAKPVVFEAPLPAPPPEEPLPSPKAPPKPTRKLAVNTDATLAEERTLLEQARSALSRGKGTEALHAVAEHERRFARGLLTEERHSLRVHALQLAGRHDEAREQARKFREKYPQSILLPAIEEALGPP
jgi:hypothetical protein